MVGSALSRTRGKWREGERKRGETEAMAREPFLSPFPTQVSHRSPLVNFSHALFYHAWIQHVLWQIRLLKEVQRSSTLCKKICSCCAFQGPEANLFCVASDVNPCLAWLSHNFIQSEVSQYSRNLQQPDFSDPLLPSSAVDPGGGVRGVRMPPPPSDLMLVWDWNSCIERIVYHLLTCWFFF